MAFGTLRELNRGTAGDRESEGVADREFVLESTDGTDTREDARLATGVPQVGDTDPLNSQRSVRDVTVEEFGRPDLFRIRVNYSTVAVSTNPAGNPLLAEPTRRWTFVAASTPIRRATFLGNITAAALPSASLIGGGAGIANYPIVNSAFEQYDPTPEAGSDGSGPVFLFQRNELEVDPGWMNAYAGAVNTDAFLGALPGQARIARIDADQMTNSGLTYWSIVYEFHFREYGWLLTLLDQGLREAPYWNDTTLDADTRARTFHILDANGVPISDPVPLDGTGLRLDPGEEFVYRRFQVYRELPFSLLGVTAQ